ncbi:class I SAM-dependent methyltransferase [Gimesia sp.]|uniref:class I SAM-dependent methyltransferase n=1 Tax=Gimesia sp. TaxID=2024833 RepID=UPI003A929C3E
MSFDRAFSLARYNWPLYLTCFLGVALGFIIWKTQLVPPPIRYLGLLAAVVATWYTIASFVAFHVMFDHSDFLSGEWLTRCVEQSPNTCVQLSVCVEETTLPISKVFASADYIELDLFDESVMTEPAIARAKQKAGDSPSIVAKPEALPLTDHTSELTVVTLAAHEVRDPSQREALFQELSRITAPGGRLIIVEHIRNLPAAAVFGPGLFHFYPRTTWTTLAQKTKLRIESEFDITPFFHVFVLRHG